MTDKGEDENNNKSCLRPHPGKKSIELRTYE